MGLADPDPEPYPFAPRGLDASKTYRVTVDNVHATETVQGTTLMEDGLRVCVTAERRSELVLFEVLEGVPIAFQVEPLGMLFALVASGLWIPTSVYAFGYMRGHHEHHQTRFFVCFAVAIFAALGIAFAGNLQAEFAGTVHL